MMVWRWEGGDTEDMVVGRRDTEGMVVGRRGY